MWWANYGSVCRGQDRIKHINILLGEMPTRESGGGSYIRLGQLTDCRASLTTSQVVAGEWRLNSCG